MHMMEGLRAIQLSRTQLTFNYSKSVIEPLEKGEKYVQN